MQPDPPWARGHEVKGRYRIEERIGSGGMGVVYRATQLQLRQPCALKVIDSDRFGPHHRQPLLRRFRREAQLGFRVRHAGLVAVFDFDQLDDGTLYYAMELLGGKSLAALLGDDGPLGWPEAAELGIQAADALAALHRAGVVHRDLKPENLQLLPDGRLKVLDFGVVHAACTLLAGASEITDVHTFTGQQVGTPAYMSPEQLRDSSRVDARDDLYALALVLYELVSGYQPFRGRPVEEVYQLKFMPGVLPPLPEICPAVPPRLEALLAQMLGARPGRPRTARAVGAALRALLSGVADREAVRRRLAVRAGGAAGTPLSFAGGDTRHDAAEPQAGRTPVLLYEPAPAPARRSAGAGAAGIVLVLGLAVLGLWSVQRRHDAPAAPRAAAPAPDRPPLRAGSGAGPAAAVEAALRAPAGPERAGNRRRPAAERKTGQLRIGVRPYAEIYLDGVYRKEGCPYTYTLPAGNHAVRAVNSALGRDETRSVRVAPGGSASLLLDWSEHAAD